MDIIIIFLLAIVIVSLLVISFKITKAKVLLQNQIYLLQTEIEELKNKKNTEV